MITAEEYLSAAELAALGLGSFGRNVFISRKAAIARPGAVFLGSCIRIDSYCSIIGRERLEIGDHVHIGSSVTISVTAPVTIGRYSGLASGVRLFTSDDDYSGAYLTGPTVPVEEARVTVGPVQLQSHNVIGANSVVLPSTTLEEGAVIGALSLAQGTYAGWTIYGGVPARALKPRSKELLERVPES